MVAPVILPTTAQIDRRLAQMLAADSAQTGETTARLMLMLTRSCELRCSYCFVALSEASRAPHPGTPEAGIPEGDMALATAIRAVDQLMTSQKPRLSLQLFGGEPTRAWEVLRGAVHHATRHPGRDGRPLQVLLTTNGLGLQRVGELDTDALVVQRSIDGWGAGNRFRRPHLLTQAEADERWLVPPDVDWFLNVTVPPAAAGELLDRYVEARSHGVPALQLNYATGVAWSEDQRNTYLSALAATLQANQLDASPRLYNRQHAADPAPLCGDTLVDVDGTILQVGGVFHERRFPALRAAYRHGHLDDGLPFDRARVSLAELWRRTRAALAPAEAQVFLDGMRVGAGADIVGRMVG